MATVSLVALAMSASVADTGLRPDQRPIPDPVAAYLDNYQWLYEDGRVRVLDFTLGRGDSEEFHRHPATVAVSLSAFRIRFRLPDGRETVLDAHLADVAYSPDPVVHSPMNIGGSDAHGNLIEFKQSTAGSPPPAGAVP